MRRDTICELIKHRFAEYIHFPEQGKTIPANFKWIWLDWRGVAHASITKPKNGQAKAGETPIQFGRIRLSAHHGGQSINNNTDFCFKIADIRAYYPYHEILDMEYPACKIFTSLLYKHGRSVFKNWISVNTFGKIAAHENHPQMTDEENVLDYIGGDVQQALGPYYQRVKGGFAPRFIIHTEDLFNVIGRYRLRLMREKKSLGVKGDAMADTSAQEALARLIIEKEEKVSKIEKDLDRLEMEKRSLVNSKSAIVEDINSMKKSIEILNKHAGIK